MQKHVNLVDLVKSFPTNIYLQNLVSIQPRTSPIKFAHLAEKSEDGSISNLSTKDLRGQGQDAGWRAGDRVAEPRSDGDIEILDQSHQPSPLHLAQNVRLQILPDRTQRSRSVAYRPHRDRTPTDLPRIQRSCSQCAVRKDFVKLIPYGGMRSATT